MEQPFSAEYIQELSHKYKNGLLGTQEKADFELWYGQFDDTVFVHSGAADPAAVKERIYNQLLKQIKKENPAAVRRLNTRWLRMAAAASVAVFLSLAIILFVTKHSTQTTGTFAQHDILPGGNKAFLVLGNGKKISLTDAKNGQLAVQGGINVSKTAYGKLVYATESNYKANALVYHTIETPRGGQYQVILPDGTKVWLNAASSLRYPASFASLKERQVELSGEAYFEVAHHRDQPFRVLSNGEVVEDIGTQFNINSYHNEPLIKTTLIEGSASVSIPSNGKKASNIKKFVLIPGQQAELNEAGAIKISTADIQEVVAWKNGDFEFRNADFRTVMRKIERWYDVEVIYDASAPLDIPLGGLVSRTKNISVLLNLMEQTGAVHFKVEGRKITISK